MPTNGKRSTLLGVSLILHDEIIQQRRASDWLKSEYPREKTLAELGADSLSLVSIALALEEDFEVEVPDAEFEKLKTVGDVVDYIDRKVASR